MQEQLVNFIEKFSACFYDDLPLKTPKNWREAFRLLTDEMVKFSKGEKVILFFDELPWLASKKSRFLQALDYIWNSKWCRMKNVKLIVCGSAASWILDKIINAKGGLYNRITGSILLKPYLLSQAKEFLKVRGCKFNDKQILDIYMVLGGIPYYLQQISPGLSAVQNISHLCFQEDGLLYSEFDRLFRSLFDAHEMNQEIVRIIASKRMGISRTALIEKLQIHSGGVIESRIRELVAAGFIEKIIPYGKKAKDQYYRIIDEYSLFYMKWIEAIKAKSRRSPSEGYWEKMTKHPSKSNWAGYAFEEVCYKHIEQIAKALGLKYVSYHSGSWKKVAKRENRDDQGAQVDLLFDRDDGIIDLCEIKYSETPFSIDKNYAKQLDNKVEQFEKYFKTDKEVRLDIVTVFGIKPTFWSDDLISNKIMLADMFQD